MLKQLSINNYILIKSLEFDFSDGFMVVTGETGAGKSIFIGALELLLGARLTKDVIGPYSDKTIIEGIFEFTEDSHIYPKLIDAGFDGDEFIFSRLIEGSGKSVYRINRQLVTLSLVKEILQDEIDIHSQFNTQSLLNEKNHLLLLDDIVNNQSLINEVRCSYQKYQKDKKKKNDFLKEQLSEQEIVQLQQEINRLLDLNLEIEEEQDLLNEISLMNEEQSLVGELTLIMDTLEQLDYSALYPFTQKQSESEITQLLSTAYFSLEEAHHETNKRYHILNFDEEKFNHLNARLTLINSIKRRYSMNIDEILEYIKTNQQKIEDSKDIEKAIIRFDKIIDESYELFQNKASVLSELRHQAASLLESQIIAHGQDLNMKDMQFKIQFIEHESEKGTEDIRFTVSMNKGMALQPLALVASGGELSRLMLILKIIFNINQSQKLIVFDEIDTGVSGKVAQLMGQKIKVLSKKHRILMVTHLPLIAVFGDRHIKVIKKDEKNLSFVEFIELNESERLNELATMIGSSINDASLQAANNLILQTKELSK